jgi:hypothetical protein
MKKRGTSCGRCRLLLGTFAAGGALLLSGVASLRAAEAREVLLSVNPTADRSANSPVTTVRITDRVLVKDTIRFGINLGGDNYYSGAVLVKMRARENFEGTLYRQCHFGPGSDEHGVSTWFRPRGDWIDLLKGGRYTILSGPSKWTSGVVRDIIDKQYLHEGQMEPFAYFLLDKEIQPPPEGTRIGIMIERFRTEDGQFRSLDGYWTSPDNEISIGDVPPGSFGSAALDLKGSAEKAHVRFGTHYQRYGQTNGTWHVRFWAKARRGEPELTVSADRGFGDSITLKPKPQWTRYEELLVVDKVPEPKGPKDNPHLLFTLQAARGDVLVDDVEIWMEGDRNPTAFRDDCVATLKRFNPGVLRKLQMGGSTVDNTLAPPLASYSYASQPGSRLGPYHGHSRDDYSLHEMYVLCEHLGCDPWYCLPGTVTLEEMRHFMEYLGAPADVGYGRRRAELGHPKPWTEVFQHVHVEFGNEAWNNAGPYQCGGFNGPDYWHDLIQAGKTSPHYRPNVLFHAAGQAAYVGRNEGIIKDVPNADRFGVAPYIIQGFSKEECESYLNTDAKLFRWAFAWPIRRSCDPAGAMFQNYQLARKAGMELSIYEVNHHTTHGDGPLEPRNKLVTSIGGGINVANNMLLMLKEHHLRTQCLFSLIQHSYNARGIGPVRLWGTALCMRAGHERYRPTFLACATANKVLGGDLVETVHTGLDPKFQATGVFSQREGAETLKDLPVIWSYAFAEGKRRGLILVSLDVAEPRPVAVTFDGDVAGGAARCWLLTADRITDNNEFEAPQPQVEVDEERITGFRSGTQLVLPPFSMRVLAWEMR